MNWFAVLFGIIVTAATAKSEDELISNKVEGSNSDSRIVGGADVKENVPYQVSLQVKNTYLDVATLSIQQYQHFCGGSVITNQHVLTAAHCVVGMAANQFTVYLGTKFRTRGGLRFVVDEIYTHPEYIELVQHDIAVLRLKDTIVLDGKRIDKIDYTSRDYVGGSVNAYFSGWGFSYIYPLVFLGIDTLPNTLQEMTYKTITNEECNAQGYNTTKGEVCLFSRVLNGACSGDSGGPLTNEEKTIQWGVTSYGTRVCAVGLPDVFTRVSEHVDWITEQTLKV